MIVAEVGRREVARLLVAGLRLLEAAAAERHAAEGVDDLGALHVVLAGGARGVEGEHGRALGVVEAAVAVGDDGGGHVRDDLELRRAAEARRGGDGQLRPGLALVETLLQAADVEREEGGGARDQHVVARALRQHQGVAQVALAVGDAIGDLERGAQQVLGLGLGGRVSEGAGARGDALERGERLLAQAEVELDQRTIEAGVELGDGARALGVVGDVGGAAHVLGVGAVGRR